MDNEHTATVTGIEPAEEALLAAETFIVERYRLVGAAEYTASAMCDSTAAVDIAGMAGESAFQRLCDRLRESTSITEHPDPAGRRVVMKATLDLPYIRSKVMEDLERKLHAAEHTQDQLRFKCSVLRDTIAQLKLPWYTKLWHWLKELE